MSDLTFRDLRVSNAKRYNADAYRRCQTEWQTAHWLQAMVGEVGGLANLLKKVDRGDFTLDFARNHIADELADIQIYLDLLAFKLGLDLGAATVKKFNEVSQRIGSDIVLPEDES